MRVWTIALAAVASVTAWGETPATGPSVTAGSTTELIIRVREPVEIARRGDPCPLAVEVYNESNEEVKVDGNAVTENGFFADRTPVSAEIRIVFAVVPPSKLLHSGRYSPHQRQLPTTIPAKTGATLTVLLDTSALMPGDNDVTATLQRKSKPLASAKPITVRCLERPRLPEPADPGVEAQALKALTQAVPTTQPRQEAGPPSPSN